MKPPRTPEAADALARLGLGPADRAALARQGFVAAEWRRRGGRRWGPYFKLRWRRGGVQRVRYLGREVRISRPVANRDRSASLFLSASLAAAVVTKGAEDEASPASNAAAKTASRTLR